MLQTVPMSDVTKRAETLARAIARKNGITGDVRIIIGATGQGKKHGHFAPHSWTDANGNIGHEIMLAGESLERGALATFGTLAHELAHLANNVEGIRDTSDGNRWHNDRFKSRAESFGLTIEHGKDHGIPRAGWSVTSVPDAAITPYRREFDAFAKALDAAGWRTGPRRIVTGGTEGGETEGGETEGAEGGNTRTTYRMACPECAAFKPVRISAEFAENVMPQLACMAHDYPVRLALSE